MIGPNPVREVVRPRAPNREQMVLTESEMRRLIEAAGSLELRALSVASASWRCASARRLAFRSQPTTRRNARSAFASKSAERREPKPLTMIIKDYAKSPWGIRTLRVSDGARRRARCDCRVRRGQAEPARVVVHRHPGGHPQRAELSARPMATDASTRRVRRAGHERQVRARTGLTPHVLRHSRASLIASRHSERGCPVRCRTSTAVRDVMFRRR